MESVNPFITKSDDLVTSPAARRDGFLEVALHKSGISNVYLDQAKALQTNLKENTNRSQDILNLAKERKTLLLAAGLSTKAQGNLTDDDKKQILQEFEEKVIRPCGQKYIDEIVYRYLLSLGEQLGGKMRNVIGDIAREKLSRCIIAQLRILDFSFSIHCNQGKWIDGSEYTENNMKTVKAIRWECDGHQRTLLHNINVPNLGTDNKPKNVDIVVFSKFVNKIKGNDLKDILKDQKNFVVMGELKGGFDPAGADEHWKTTRGALERIRTSYRRVNIAFVGAAIEKSMAAEIFNQLQSKDISNAANMTNCDQMNSFCKWLVNQ